MVPQVVIDCAENLIKSTNPNIKDSYTLRLEAIRDYCDYVLKMSGSPSKQVFDKKTKTQINYSRIGKNNA
jgi:hypothetical protein